MLTRSLAPLLRSDPKSVLLLGPRQTGKSTLMASLSPEVTLNLAREATFLEMARNPQALEEKLLARNGPGFTVFLDEIQRLPSLLNTVQALIDEHPGRFRFLLTGSSARKLKRGGANLLPGRIHTYALGAITAGEMGYRFPVRQAMSTGALPGVLTHPSERTRRKTLVSYASTYLKEEIQAEALARAIEGFARFITAAAEWSGQFLDIAKLATVALAPRNSVSRWIEVLEDTLLVRRIGAFAKSATRRLVQHPKLFFFDVGVLNGLLNNFEVSADRIGALFEHLVCQQLFDGAAAVDEPIRVSTFRTEHGAEVDFIAELRRQIWAIELKASTSVSPADLSGLARFGDYLGGSHRSRVWYLGPDRRKVAGVDVLPWQQGLRELGL
ncbi:MAG: ATP-binding protein [Myxococcales bacterium]|nr:ATP-binding protein [Myxococcales bacterium]